jgi:anti-anti-sigma regulatory factor
MTTLVLPARCDRAAAEALWPEMVAAIGGTDMTIDGTAVEQMGQAVLQLLVSARRSAGATIAPSPVLRDVAALTGLCTELFDDGARPDMGKDVAAEDSAL